MSMQLIPSHEVAEMDAASVFDTGSVRMDNDLKYFMNRAMSTRNRDPELKITKSTLHINDSQALNFGNGTSFFDKRSTPLSFLYNNTSTLNLLNPATTTAVSGQHNVAPQYQQSAFTSVPGAASQTAAAIGPASATATSSATPVVLRHGTAGTKIRTVNGTIKLRPAVSQHSTSGAYQSS